MNRSTSETAKILGVPASQVKRFAWNFKDYLSSSANPTKAQPRVFGDEDLLVLIFINHHWEEDPDIEAIKTGLNAHGHHEEPFVRELYLHTPLLQDPPDDLDETWRHGIILGGGGKYDYLEFARHFRHAAESMLQSARERDDLEAWAYPVLFAYRHTLELYLKLLGEIDIETHSLAKCVERVERRHGKKFKSPVREWMLELHTIDPNGTAFRYSDEEPGTGRHDEIWFDFEQFQFAMKLVFDALDHLVLRLQPVGKPPKKRR